MGGAASTLSRPSRISSGNDLLAKTKDVREMSNALFTFMFSQWEDKEIWEIANNPGDYVVALSDLITSQFHVLGYTTKRNQIGEIYFAKYDKLKPPSQEGEKGIIKQRENTQIIAFYFIRLFQIMGAMLLVVKDISFPVLDTKTGQVMDLGTPEASRRPYVNREQMVLPRFKGGAVIGGAAVYFPRDVPLGAYEFLRDYLRQVSSETAKAYTDKYGVTLTSSMYQISPNLFLEYTPLSGASQISAGQLTKQKFWLLTTKQQGKGELKSQDVTVAVMNPSSLPGYLAPGDPTFNTAAKQLARYPISVSFTMSVGQRTPQIATVNRVDSEVKKESYASGAEYYFDSGTNVELLLAQYDAKKDFTKILDFLVLLAVRTANNDKSIQLYRAKEEVGVAVAAIGKMPEKIKSETINGLYQALKGTPGALGTPGAPGAQGAQPHCIARALQLLDTKSLQESIPMAAKTSVCKFAIGDQAGPTNLTTYKPVKSIAQLFGKVDPANFKGSMAVLEAFVGKDAAGEPLTVQGLAGQPGEADALKKALTKLALAFQYIQKEEPVESLSQIQVSRPSECATFDIQDVKSQPLALKLQSVAQQLLAYHINHTIEIAKFLKTIFNISQAPNGTWKVEGPKTDILFAGFPILDRLTDQARELLVDYYSGCETLYQKGLNTWKEGQPKATNVAKANEPGPVVPGPVAPGPVLTNKNNRSTKPI